MNVIVQVTEWELAEMNLNEEDLKYRIIRSLDQDEDLEYTGFNVLIDVED